MKQSPDQLDLLTTADRQRQHPRVEWQLRSEVAGHLRKARAQCLVIDNAAAQLGAAEDQILLDRQQFNELEVLVDERDAGLLGIRRRAQNDVLAQDVDIARVESDRPTSIFTRVDLPAPFSPTMPTISPGKMENETSSLARRLP